MAGNGGFAFRQEQYNPERLKRMDERKVRSEYRKLQKRAASRLKTFEKAGLSETSVYRYNKEMLQSISKLDKGDLAYALADAYRFLTSARGTAAGYIRVQQKAVDTLNAGGLTGINMDNIDAFGRYMEYARAQGIARGTFDSERAAEAFAELYEENETTPEEAFLEWMESDDYYD